MPTTASLRARATTPEAQDAFKRWFDAAPLYSGGRSLNRFGWQPVRSLAKCAAIAARPARTPDWVPHDLVGALDRDGYVVVPHYLGAERHGRLQAAFEEYGSSRYVRDIGDENDSHIGYRTGPVRSDGPSDAGARLLAAFDTDPLIRALAERVIHRRIRGPLPLVYQRLSTGGSEDRFDREQLLHADRHYPCAKAIYCVDDVTSESGPFVYCPGSHRLSADRLAWEWEIGRRESELRDRAVDPDSITDPRSVAFERGRNVIGPAFRSRLGLLESPLTCAADTLIIVNNQGFHRRSALAPGATRSTLWVNFYKYQRPVLGRLAFAAVKQMLDTDNVSRALPQVHTIGRDDLPTRS